MQTVEAVVPLRIVPPKETAGRLGVDLRTLQRLVSKGEFPKPVRVSANRIGFREGDVHEWIASRPEAA